MSAAAAAAAAAAVVTRRRGDQGNFMGRSTGVCGSVIGEPFSLSRHSNPFIGFRFDSFCSLGTADEPAIDWKETHVFKTEYISRVKKEEVKVEVEEGRVLKISREEEEEEEEEESGKIMRRLSSGCRRMGRSIRSRLSWKTACLPSPCLRRR